MYFKIPYSIYHDEFKGSLIRLKWNTVLKMFETINEKEGDLPEDLLKYKVTFIDVPFVDKDDVKEMGGKWNPEKRCWYYVNDTDNKAFFQRYRVIEDP